MILAGGESKARSGVVTFPACTVERPSNRGGIGPSLFVLQETSCAGSEVAITGLPEGRGFYKTTKYG
jgi:hypothetical protein